MSQFRRNLWEQLSPFWIFFLLAAIGAVVGMVSHWCEK